jgi:P4 family phage/plasmid primase-like protien
MSDATLDVTALLLGTLGHRNGEFTSLLYLYPGDDTPHTAVMDPGDAVAAAVQLPAAANCYFGVNPVAGPARKGAGKGKEADVTRLAALFADLDVKPGAFASIEVAEDAITELSGILGTPPSAIVYSGGGVQPYWPISDGDDIAAARPILKRWYRLVAAVADRFDASVDNVYNLDRVLRLPGTSNHKTGTPRSVYAAEGNGGPLELAEIAERLDEFGIFELPEDTEEVDRTEVSTPADWQWAQQTCPYVAAMVAGFATDSPKKGTGRSPWLISCKVRLNCAKRLGCITEVDYKQAEANLEKRFAEVVADPKFDTPRAVKKFEHRDTMRHGVKRASEKTDEQCRAELGDHGHGTVVEVIEGEIVASGDDSVRAFRLPDGHRATDVGNAARLVEAAADRLRYVHAWGKWLVYHRGRWIVDDKDALVTEIAKQVPRGLYKLAAKVAADDTEAAKEIWMWALMSDKSSAISSMIRLARGTPGLLVSHEDLDADPWLLNVANGSIDLRTGEFRDHDPADLCTLQSPVRYDPDAQAPLWAACLKRWQPDESVLTYIQTRAGAAATGIPTETVDVDFGGGGNGKSKFHGAVQQVLGPYATVPHKSLLVQGRFEQHPTVVAGLFRKRMAIASETKAAESLDDESVKNLTGGDRLKARRMREDEWEFWPTHTLVMFSNHKPSVSGRDEGIWRRLRLVPWEVTIGPDERDDQLATKLAGEGPGILRWIVAGAQRFHRDGLKPPAAVLDATARYRHDEDVVGRFIAEALTIDASETGQRVNWCHSVDIKSELDGWCEEQSIAAPPSMNDVAATLREMGCKPGGRKQVGGKRSTIWHGVCVTPVGGEGQ